MTEKGKTNLFSKGGSDENLEALLVALEPLRSDLLTHPVYQGIRSNEDLRTFLEHHIFAVWDFMSLLKALQIRFTFASFPWVPEGDPVVRRIINEIVLEEESDDGETGEVESHFEMYLGVMRECGADTSSVDRFVQLLKDGEWIERALGMADVPKPSLRFVHSTWKILETRSTHGITAAFVFGREYIVRDMYGALLTGLRGRFSGVYREFEKYLERLVEVDENRHQELTLRLLTSLCGNDPVKWAGAEQTARECLGARIALWDGIYECIIANNEDKNISMESGNRETSHNPFRKLLSKTNQKPRSKSSRGTGAAVTRIETKEWPRSSLLRLAEPDTFSA